jgi:hypothetical protein
MVTQFLISFVVLLLLTGGLFANDDERDRKARVALALAATERTPVAPAPHIAALPGYAEAYRLALKYDQPLVVYVGCEGRHPIERLPSVVVSAARELEGYDRGSVVVGYPRDGKLFVHAALRCPDHGDPVAKAAEDARKKITAAPVKTLTAPVPPCVCGPGCDCPGGVCPQRCPVVMPR